MCRAKVSALEREIDELTGELDQLNADYESLLRAYEEMEASQPVLVRQNGVWRLMLNREWAEEVAAELADEIVWSGRRYAKVS